MGNNGIIWEYQTFSQITLKSKAESLFGLLDKNLNPKISLIGILKNKNSNKDFCCIEQENETLNPEEFNDVYSIAKELMKIDGENNVFHSHSGVALNHFNGRIKNSYREAILKILESRIYFNEVKYFVSYPVEIDEYWVFAAIKIDSKTIESYYSLTKQKFSNRFKIYRSLIESLISEFLSFSEKFLSEPNSGADLGSDSIGSEEILRKAAIKFMYSVSNVGNNYQGLHGLFEACNIISSLKYEGADGLGGLIISKKDHPNIKLILELEIPIEISNYRKVRKFLELSEKDQYLICDSHLIYGIGNVTGYYNPREESIFTINFVSHYSWELLHDKNVLMKVSYREPSLFKQKIDRELFFSDMKRIFKNLNQKQIFTLWDIIIKATEQKHGTMIVISEKAKEESERLGKPSFRLKPFKIPTEIILPITSIDGAVFLDPYGTCWSIGVILDGLATEKGDSSRGARYNSAVRYYEQIKDEFPCLVIIISEDGMINLIPKLFPQIKHSIILNKISELEKLNELSELDNKKFNQLMDWFEKNEFYLSEEECEKINSLFLNIDSKIELGIGIFKIQRSKLYPHEDMNKDYYLEENLSS